MIGIDHNIHDNTSYPTSIITRIETGCEGENRLFEYHFLPHFHYNKDWNILGTENVLSFRLSSYPTSIITRIETPRTIHISSVSKSSYPTSIITRIETYYEKDTTVKIILLLTPLPL